MMSRIHTAVISGIEGCRVTVEADITNGLPKLQIVGLAATTVMESRERIKSAIQHSGYDYPRRKVTVNLKPANLRKTGSHLDLPIAVGLLASMGYVNTKNIDRIGILGECSLDGTVSPVDGVLPMCLALFESGIRLLIVPKENAEEAAMIEGAQVYGIESLRACMDVINTEEGQAVPPPSLWVNGEKSVYREDFSDIRGQDNAKRAITVAAAGNHGLLMVGNPGSGKTMLAKRIPTILPDMSPQEILEDSIIYSVSGKQGEKVIRARPFRMPHHSIGRAGLLGGGLYPVPGELTLAHNGVLFLDEICEFDRETIESLRIPLEEKCITHFRSGKAYEFPCNVLLVMAANPCMCGFYGDDERECICSGRDLIRYRRKLSGPLLDRVDLTLRMSRVKYKDLAGGGESPVSSEEMRIAVIRAREFARSMGRAIPNSELDDKSTYRCCALSTRDHRFLQNAYDTLHLSPRTFMKTLKVARTIADLECSERVETVHISEALSYRAENGF